MPRAQSDASLPLIDPHLVWLARLQRLRGARLQRFYAGEVVMHEGELPETVAVVTEGAVATSSRTASGRVATLSVLGPFDLVGHQAVASEPAPETVPGVVALKESTLLTVPATSVAAVLRHDTLLLRGLAAAVAEQLDRAHLAFARALTLPVVDRVRHAVRDLAARFGTPVPGGIEIILPVSQDLLASIAGATRESVNRAIRELKRTGEVRTEDGRYIYIEAGAGREPAPRALQPTQGRFPGLS
ncbi:MAG TPA: Crp/Fnr family transcriptional regulator [Actinomycetota bacterium]|nr:Crp/Fnr family transcriptional regulator [Actinomycetota bacterium]